MVAADDPGAPPTETGVADAKQLQTQTMRATFLVTQTTLPNLPIARIMVLACETHRRRHK